MSNETSQETWNATHAQLLKSVADAQAKLLAAQNETCDKVESTSRNLGLAEKRLTDRLEGLAERLTTLTVSAAALNANHAGLKVLIAQTQEAVRNSHHDLQAGVMALLGRLDKQPRWPVEKLEAKGMERLRPKRIGGSRSHVKRAVERKRRQ